VIAFVNFYMDRIPNSRSIIFICTPIPKYSSK
jgi:hypothetical protein